MIFIRIAATPTATLLSWYDIFIYQWPCKALGLTAWYLFAGGDQALFGPNLLAARASQTRTALLAQHSPACLQHTPLLAALTVAR